MNSSADQAIILISCPDQRGIISAVTDFISENNGNILDLDEHVDATDKEFFMRVAWDLAEFQMSAAEFTQAFQANIADRYRMQWDLRFSSKIPRMAIFVSKLSHCLYDIMGRYQSGEWNVKIPLIVSNHQKLQEVADRYEIPFFHFPISKENKADQERQQIKLMQEHEIDLSCWRAICRFLRAIL